MGLYDELAKCFVKDAETIHVNRDIIKKANSITQRYSRGYIEPKVLQHMYKELERIGITTDIVTNARDTTKWYYNGKEVENSFFVYQVHEGKGDRNEYNIYFS